MTATLQRIVEQVNTLTKEERDELARLLAEGAEGSPLARAEQDRLLAGIRQRRSFSPAEHQLPDSILLLREDRER